MAQQDTGREKHIDEFVKRLRGAADENLQSVVLYGSAAGGEFHPGFSNINLLCVLGNNSFSSLRALSPACKWWKRQGHSAPLVLTQEELIRSADVFAIEFLDMTRRHQVLFGADPLKSLEIPLHLHRAQVEYELREKLILLRGRILAAASDSDRLWELLLGSVSSFVTLFRHALIILGEPAPDSQRAALQALSTRIPFEVKVFDELLSVRERNISRKQLDLADIFSRYLKAIEQVVLGVDTMLDSAVSR
jgi:hypothetical protein